MTGPRLTRVDPPPTPEEAAAIAAALEIWGEDGPVGGVPVRSRWRLAGLLGEPVPPGMKLEGSLWSYSRWKGGR